MSSRLARLCLVSALSAFPWAAHAQPTTPGAQPPAAQPPGAPPQLPTNPQAQPAAAVAQAQTAGAAARAELIQPIQPAPPVDELVALKLPDVDIDTVLTALEIYTGRVALRPQQLTTATYNIKTPGQIPKAEAILAIQTALQLNGIGIAPLGTRFIKVVNLQNVKGEAPLMISGSAFDYPSSGMVATKLFQLEFLRVAELQAMLTQGMLNPYFGGPVPLQNANALLITDTISNLQRIELLVRELDKPVTAGMKPRFFTLKNGAKASDVVNKLRTILTGTLQTQLGQATTYSADDRTNQIIVVTDPRQWDFFAELIEQLDQRADPNTRTEVLYLKHAKAQDVVTVLSNIISKQTTALQRSGAGPVRPGQLGQPPAPMPVPGAQPQPQQPAQPQIVSASAGGPETTTEFSALMTVVNDERSNAVVVFGTEDDIRLVRGLVDKLDIALAQVRIEVVVAEVTLTDNHQTGISQLGLRVEGDKLVGFSGISPGIDIRGPDGAAGSLATITRPGSSGPWDLAGMISLVATPRKDNTAILSVPTITTSHAKEGNVFVGETRPVVSGTILSGVGGGATSTTTQLQIGIDLTVKPLIGIDHSVQLEIKQAVDEVGPNQVEIDGNLQPVILKRTMNSFVTVKSGEIIVLAGLQRSSNSRTSSRLGPIPIIGDIFGSRTRAKSRTELIFFLRPHVLTNTPADNADAFKRLDELPHGDAVRQQLDPTYVPPKSSVLDKILPK